jgi:hypothetical protein
MIKNYLLVLLVLCFPFGILAQDLSEKYAETITEADLKKHLTIIASDEMEGRETGSPGQFKAAAYIAEQFQNLGLQQIEKDSQGNPSFYQDFKLYQKGWTEAYMKVNGQSKVFFKDFYPNGMVNVPEEQTIEVVFTGYGLDSKAYNDYKGLEVHNKAVIYFEGLPKGFDITSLTTAEFSSEAGKDKYLENLKLDLAKEKGASYIFIISKDAGEQFLTRAAERKAVLSRFNRMVLEKGKSTPETNQPSFVVSYQLASDILGMSVAKLKKIESKTAKKKTPIANKVAPKIVTLKTKRDEEQVASMNVLGFMEGTDKKDEVLVISSHYDHIGMNSKGEVYNGADDDGSGTCAVLEIAEAFAKAKSEGNGPRRSILFITVAGEEKGLLGSRYYTDVSPTIPLANTICDLNIDMIGRIDKEHADNEKYIYLIGSDKLSSELHSISEEVNKKYINFELDYTFNDPNDPNRFYYRSDHYNFAKNKIPVIFYFSGVHEDYHGLGDEVEKIMFPKYSQISRLVFHTAWDLVNREERIKVDSNKK